MTWKWSLQNFMTIGSELTGKLTKNMCYTELAKPSSEKS